MPAPMWYSWPMSETAWLVTELLVLLTAANGAPVLATRVLGERWSWPLDGGLTLADGRRLLGTSKTVRGLVASVAVTAAVGVLLGMAWWLGALFGAASMAGDLTSSFIKRRLGIASSGRALGLDQVPEALLPLLVCYGALGLAPLHVLLTLLLFSVGSPLISPLMFRIGIRHHPH